MVMGPAPSPYSFAALPAGRASLQKGAARTLILAFLFGATNLSPQVAALAWIFLGRQFALALVLGSVVHAAIMAVMIRFTYSEKMVEQARKDAEKTGKQHGGMGDPAEGLSGKWRDKIKGLAAWLRIGQTYAAPTKPDTTDALYICKNLTPGYTQGKNKIEKV